MNCCRFEDRLKGVALALHGPQGRIAANHPDQLPEAFARIEQARRSGAWIALLLDYELGEWLEPALADAALAIRPPAGSGTSVSASAGTPPADPAPRLTALIFDRASHEAPWSSAPARIARAVANVTRDDYLLRVDQIRRWIAAGEVYQVNTTFGLDVTTEGSPADLYRHIASANPVAHAAYIEDEGRTVLSFSPELFLERTGSTLVTRPMKGTAPRSADPARDRALGEQLLHSVKDRAENLMIVDLLRNDMGRIAAPGSVRAHPLFTLERYPTVWTMTSTVQATLAEGVDLAQILRALFPCGSVTGAPKIAAMRKILATEPLARGLYCGSIGWLAPNGDFSLNVAIRTLVIDGNGRGLYGIGGGIVYDSDPAREWDEAHWKARVLTQIVS
ncbi:MAG: aminodeoxychorismate synthase component I [Burkholderiaceae bacterium]|nr:aminodeoxychorismate synthase component I [Burkholderiaceae bacterium]